MDKKKKMGGAERQRLKRTSELKKSAEKCQKMDIYVKKKKADIEDDLVASVSESHINQQDNQPLLLEIDENKLSVEAELEFETIVTSESANECTPVPTCDSTNECISSIPNTDISVDYFDIPRVTGLSRSQFLNYHPKQPTTGKFLNWNRTFLNKGKNRKWLTYSNEKEALYCFVCMAYGDSVNEHGKNIFMRGLTDFRHHYTRIQEHEKSSEHSKNAEAFFLDQQNANVEQLMENECLSLRRQQVQTRRDVMKRIIDVLKVIGKCGLSFRGKRNEAARTLDDPDVNHGNFLELLLLLRKYDVTLNSHLTEAIENSKNSSINGSDSNKKRRGNLLTLISKTTANNIITTIRNLMQKKIAEEVREAGMFSVQLDTTQDESVIDQCSLVLRYVYNGEIKERLLDVISCNESTGKSFLELLKKALEQNNIDLSRCIGNSTDGAANMQGIYNGFSALLQKETTSLHFWCHAHVLNLFISDVTQVSTSSISLFGLLNQIAVFFKEGYQRMNVWRKYVKNKTLSKIGETRWISKQTLLQKIFGQFSDSTTALYVPLLRALCELENDKHFSSDVRFNAKNLKENLLKFEIVITAHVFLKIFKISNPLSKYLQTSSLDFMKCNDLVNDFKNKMQACSRKFEEVKKTAEIFIEKMNADLLHFEDTEDVDYDFEVESSFPTRRIKKIKRRADETASTETEFPDNVKKYQVTVYNVIMDTVVSSLEKRFPGDMLNIFSFLDPKNFSEISEETLSIDVFKQLSDLLQKFDCEASPENLRSELLHFASNWPQLKKSLSDRVVENSLFKQTSDNEDELSDEKNEEYDEDTYESEDITKSTAVCRNKKFCKNCVVCCFFVLDKYCLIDAAYLTIGLAYKYLITQSVTQVACESSFSQLRFIKNRLRTTLKEENLSAFMLMRCEPEILNLISEDEIIDAVAIKSKLLTKKLMI